jgi:hypothetical protein
LLIVPQIAVKYVEPPGQAPAMLFSLIFSSISVMDPTKKEVIYCRDQPEKKIREKQRFKSFCGPTQINFTPASARCGPHFTWKKRSVDDSQIFKGRSEKKCRRSLILGLIDVLISLATPTFHVRTAL